ncbi:MAG: hypothetical protein M3Z33_04875 [Actinomycetota bacterium]|nr:hypothetical protein [Actinomycetota bacterium]
MSPPPTPTGPVATPTSYTHCVERLDYQDQPSLNGWDPAAFIIANCAYGLGGKLVCLPPPGPGDPTPDHFRCAIGRVIEIEEVGYDKVGYEAFDNDWCINLLLAPQELSAFTPVVTAGKRAARDQKANYEAAEAEPQGKLLQVDKSAMPAPHENTDWSKQVGAFVPYFFDEHDQPVLFHFNIAQAVPLDIGPNLVQNVYNPLEKVRDQLQAQLAASYGVDVTRIPVLHCEVEGSREHDFCSIAVPIAQGAQVFSDGCHAALDWVPFGIGDAVCKVLNFLPSWLATVAAALAGLGTWGLAHPGDADVAGMVSVGDAVIISGRWVFDAAHNGANELHPVLTLQKLANGDWSSVSDLGQFAEEWCRRVSEAPPPYDVIGTVASGLTPAQQAVHDNQQRPEQKWTVHPAVDGCRGSIDLTFSPAPPLGPPPPVIR